MVCKNNKILINIFVSLCLCVIFISCRSSPNQIEALLEQTHLPLDTGASVYILADTKKSRQIIDILPIEELQDKQTKQMLDRTDYLVAAVFPRESGRHFQLAAWGNYPNSRAGMALSTSKEWEKKPATAGGSYWYSQANGLSIAMTAKQAYAVSFLNRKPVEPHAVVPGVEIPEGFSEFAQFVVGNTRVPLSCWINNPGAVLSEVMKYAGIPLSFPVQQIFINFFPFEGETEAIIRLVFENPTQARGAASVIGFASVMVPKDFEFASIFFANMPVQNDCNMDIKTARLTENDLKVLLSLLF